MGDEWFRSPEWTEDAQADFELRLGRARGHNQPQYMRIKGLALACAGQVEPARALWQRVLESDSSSGVQKATALEHLADSYVHEKPLTAEQFLRRLLADYPSLNGTTDTIEISLAELVLRKGSRADAEEAVELLNAWISSRDSPFPSVLFRWHLALIDASSALGDTETVKSAARTALQLASRGPVFPRHPDVGLVDLDRKTRKRLEKAAR